MKCFYLLFFLAFLCNSCKEINHDGIIPIGNFIFKFPPSYSVTQKKGIDSYNGEIHGDSIIIKFEYGYYSPKPLPTISEYLNGNSWLKSFIDICNQENPNKVNISMIEILGVRQRGITDNFSFYSDEYIAKCEYVAKLKWRSNTESFNYPIAIPDAIRLHTFQLDTIGGYLRKIVVANNPQSGTTGIYLKKLNNPILFEYMEPMFSMVTTKISKPQQDLILKVFLSLKVVEN